MLASSKNTRALKEILDRIYLGYAMKGEGAKRNYLGCSSLGQSCARKLWYAFHWFSEEKPDGRIYRIFDTGHKEEERVIHDLEAAGIKIIDRQRSVSYGEGLIRGHLDAVAEYNGASFVVEIKTHNRRSFEALTGGGVRRTKPEHYTQLQCYIHLSGLGGGLYIALCKDTDEYYLEEVPADPEHAELLLDRALTIVLSRSAPERISNLRSVAPCNTCGFKKLCHRVEAPKILQSCRTCRHRSPGGDGVIGPTCDLGAADPVAIEEKGCDKFLPKDEYIEFYGTPKESDGCLTIRGRDGVITFAPGQIEPS